MAGASIAQTLTNPPATETPKVEYERAISQRVNQTGQPLTIPVPLKDRNRDLGEILLRIQPDDSVLVPKAALVEKLGPVLEPATLGRLKALPEQDGRLDLAAVRQAGLPLTFNAGQFELAFDPRADQRATGDLSVGGLRGSYQIGDVVDPAKVSGYLNILGGVDQRWQTQSGQPAQTGGRVELQGVVRLRGVVAETDAVYDGALDTNRCNTGSLCTYGHSAGLKRRNSRLTYDMPDQQLRLQVGDTEANSAAYVRPIDTLGVSLEKSSRKLAPGESISPVGRSAFRIERQSEVDVIVNGAVVQHFQLQPGNYNLRDLPFNTGANELELAITDDSGDRKTLKFSTFYDGSLLGAGKTEWSLSGGAPSYVVDSGRKYEISGRIGTGLLRHGISDHVTIETSAQADSHVATAAAGIFIQTPAGVIGVQPAVSKTNAKIGKAIGVNWDLIGFRGSLGLRESIRFGADYRDTNFRTPGDQLDAATKIFLPQQLYKLRLSGAHSIAWDNDITTTLSGRYQFDNPEATSLSPYVVRGNRYGADISVAKPLAPWMSASILLGYSNETYLHGFAANFNNTKPEFRAAARVYIRPAERTSINANYDTLNKNSQVSATQSVGDGIGRWDSSVNAQHIGDTGTGVAAGALGYAGNRGEIRLSHSAGAEGLNYPSFRPLHSDERTSLRAGTSIAFADGLVAVGAPIRGGAFAIVKPHASIADKEINIGSGETVIAKADQFGPAVVSNLPHYSNSSIPIDVPDLPIGYSLGSGGFDVRPPLRAGYALEVGSAYSITAFGTLVNAEGEPLVLQSGSATSPENKKKQVTVFTNSAGRFGADGLAPGRWTLRMEAPDGFAIYELMIPANAEGLFKAGTLTPVGKE